MKLVRNFVLFLFCESVFLQNMSLVGAMYKVELNFYMRLFCDEWI